MLNRNPTGPALWRLLIISGAATVLLSCSSEADPAEYVDALSASQARMDQVVEEMFGTPLAQQVDSMMDGNGRTQDLDENEEALVRTWMVELWTSAFAAMKVHSDDIDGLDVPEAFRDRHDAYAQAIVDLRSTEDGLLAEIGSTSGNDLVDNFWAENPEIEAVDETCRQLVAVAVEEGHPFVSPLCDD